MGLVLALTAMAALALFALVVVVARTYKPVPPNSALIVYGLGGTRVVTAGGRLVLPTVQSHVTVSLEVMSLDVTVVDAVSAEPGARLAVTGLAVVKVKADDANIRRAAEHFLTRPEEERSALVRRLVAGHLRAAVGAFPAARLLAAPEAIAERLRASAQADLAALGLEIVAFTVHLVADAQAIEAGTAPEPLA